MYIDVKFIISSHVSGQLYVFATFQGPPDADADDADADDPDADDPLEPFVRPFSRRLFGGFRSNFT